MANLIINNNRHLKTEKDLNESAAQSLVASFILEGIKISIEEARKMINEASAKFQKQRI